MARARNIKPGFFLNELLAELPTEARLLFIGLWCLADREGRLEDRPKRIKGNLFPYDSFDIDPMLNQLQSNNFITRYEVDGVRFIQIENFVKHQDPHYREKASEIPPKPGQRNYVIATNVTRTQRARILNRDGYKCQQCGSEDNPCIDHIIPVSRKGNSSDDNLQVLCLSCNTKKGNKVDSTSNRTQIKEVVTNHLIPDSLIPDSLIPDSLIPDSLIPDSLIPDSLIPDSTEKQKTVRATRFDAQAHLVEIGIPQDLASDWIKLRKTKKAEATKTAINGISEEAKKAGISLEDALKECCSRGWAGFKADWINNTGPPNLHRLKPTIEDRNKAVAAQWKPPEMRNIA